MDWNPIDMARHTVDTVDGAAQRFGQEAHDAGKRLVEGAQQVGHDIAQTAGQVSSDLNQGHYGDAGKHAALGLVDAYEDTKTTADDVLGLPRVLLTDSTKKHSADPAVAANEVLHSSTFLHDGVLSDKFFRHDANANVSDSANAWDMGQILEADAATGDMKRFGQDLGILEKYRGGLSPADLVYNSFGGRNSALGYDAGWKPILGAMANQYYDDNAWIGMALLDADKVSPNQKYVDQAKQIMDLEMQGDKGTENMSYPGGEFWCREQDYRNTVTSAGSAQLALMLYQKTKTSDPTKADKYLRFAEKQFNWVDQNLNDKGLYSDGMDPNGKITDWKFSYNQGLMLGDATMLYRITGDSKYLDKAKDIADKSVAMFPVNVKGSFTEQLPFFDAVFFKNLMLLDTQLRSTPGEETNPAYRQTLATYARYVKHEINPDTGVIKTPDGHDSDTTDQSALGQASAVQILQLAQTYPPS